MFRNYLTIAVRNLFRLRRYALLNIAGLAVGMAGCLLIGAYCYQEVTYDAFHKNADRIFRIYTISTSSNETQSYATTPNALGQTLRSDYPDLSVVQLFNPYDYWLTAGERQFKENVGFASPDFLEVFSFPLRRGDPRMVLQDKQSIVITEDMAARYFGDDEPIGQILNVDGKQDFMVSGVLQALPDNSSIRFGALLPLENLGDFLGANQVTAWHAWGMHTYVLGAETFSADALTQQFPTLIEKNVPDFLKDRMVLGIQPLTDVHFNGHQLEMATGGSITAIYILISIAGLILVIACVNYINLTTAHAIARTREINVRKILGAQRSQIIKQFLSESVLLSIIAFIIGLAVAGILLPSLSAIIGHTLDLGYVTHPPILFAIAGLVGIIGIISGGYPAFFLSVRRHAASLRGRTTPSVNPMIRRLLVIFQFAVTILLIVGEVTIIRQIDYMKSQSLGLDIDGVIVLPIDPRTMENPSSQVTALLSELRSQAGILSATTSENIPGRHFHNNFGVLAGGQENDTPVRISVTSIDEAFIETYKMQLTAGRNFSEAFSADRSRQSVMINESARRLLGWDTAVGKQLRFVHGEGPYTVTGVLEDTHFRSLQHRIEPVIYRYAKPFQMPHISVRIPGTNTQQILGDIEDIWQRIIPGQPFEYTVLKETFNRSYSNEDQTVRIIGLFSVLAVILACMGLWGLVSVAMIQRTKEVGIRKVLGASVSQLMMLLSKEYVALVILANVLAWPAAYGIMNRWLQDFAYRIDLGFGVFIAGGILVLGVALITVTFQVFRAAWSNPVDTLRYE